MSSKTTTGLLIFGLLLILGVTNLKIYGHEKDLSEGARLVLKLQPLDPRSLMQGDYMILSYELAGKVSKDKSKGVIFLKPGTNDLAENTVPKTTPGAVKLKYRVLNERVLFDIESFFFQEGMAEKYEAAQYVELRVTAAGVPRIVHLLDEDFQRI